MYRIPSCVIFLLFTISANLPVGATESTPDDTASSTSARTAQNCAAASILAQGIALNIADQRNEQLAVTELRTVLGATTVNMEDFNAAKTNLLTFVNNGISIRKTNQLIAPPGNAATAGLATVANAQMAELDLSSGLTGNPSIDLKTLDTLAGDFAGGIMQNMKNMAAVSFMLSSGWWWDLTSTDSSS